MQSKKNAWLLKMGPIGRPKTSFNYQSTLRRIQGTTVGRHRILSNYVTFDKSKSLLSTALFWAITQRDNGTDRLTQNVG